MWTEFNCVDWCPVTLCFEHGDEPWGLVKGTECFDCLRDCELLMKDSFGQQATVVMKRKLERR